MRTAHWVDDRSKQQKSANMAQKPANMAQKLWQTSIWINNNASSPVQMHGCMLSLPTLFTVPALDKTCEPAFPFHLCIYDSWNRLIRHAELRPRHAGEFGELCYDCPLKYEYDRGTTSSTVNLRFQIKRLANSALSLNFDDTINMFFPSPPVPPCCHWPLILHG